MTDWSASWRIAEIKARTEQLRAEVALVEAQERIADSWFQQIHALGADPSTALYMARDCAAYGIEPQQLRDLLGFWARHGDDMTTTAKADAWEEGYRAADADAYLPLVDPATPNPYRKETT